MMAANARKRRGERTWMFGCEDMESRIAILAYGICPFYGEGGANIRIEQSQDSMLFSHGCSRLIFQA